MHPQVVEANILMSGLGAESAGLAGAHALHNGISELPESHKMLHGEKVAFGTLCQLMIEGDKEEAVRVARFCRQVCGSGCGCGGCGGWWLCDS